MKSKILKYLKEFVFFIVVLTIVTNVTSFYKGRNISHTPFAINHPNFINSEKTITPNKPILLHFWAVWCPICKAEASNIESLSKKYQVITIAVQSGSDTKIKEYLQKNHLTFPVINDKEGKIANSFHIQAYPTTLIYDKGKNLLFSDVGYSTTFSLYLKMMWANL